MASDFVMMVLLTAGAVVVMAVLGHSPAATQFSSGWVSAAMLAAVMVLVLWQTMFLLVVMHRLTALLELLTGKETEFPPRLELKGTVKRMHSIIKELGCHDD